MTECIPAVRDAAGWFVPGVSSRCISYVSTVVRLHEPLRGVARIPAPKMRDAASTAPGPADPPGRHRSNRVKTRYRASIASRFVPRADTEFQAWRIQVNLVRLASIGTSRPPPGIQQSTVVFDHRRRGSITDGGRERGRPLDPMVRSGLDRYSHDTTEHSLGRGGGLGEALTGGSPRRILPDDRRARAPRLRRRGGCRRRPLPLRETRGENERERPFQPGKTTRARVGVCSRRHLENSNLEDSPRTSRDTTPNAAKKRSDTRSRFRSGSD